MAFLNAIHPSTPSYSTLAADGAPQDYSLPSTGGFLPFEEITRQAPAPVPRVLDRETGGQFVLGQNYPNPYVGETTVPFTLTNTSDVRLDLFDLAGRKVAGIVRKNQGAGEHTIKLNLGGLGLPPGDYLYQLQVSNSRGVYRQSKLMTAA
ncbi:hypothetical protein GCM10027511_02480 [Hymenobacter humi]